MAHLSTVGARELIGIELHSADNEKQEWVPVLPWIRVARATRLTTHSVYDGILKSTSTVMMR